MNRSLYYAPIAAACLLCSCISGNSNQYHYAEPEKENPWVMGSGASFGTEDKNAVIVLKGTNDQYANYRQKLNDFTFSGELRFEKSSGEDSWVGIQWSLPRKTAIAGQDGGYYLFFRKSDSSCHLFKGPWNPELKTMYDGKVEKAGNRYIKFKVEKKGSRFVISIDDDTAYEYSDPQATDGYAGLLAWSENGLTAIYRNVEIE